MKKAIAAMMLAALSFAASAQTFVSSNNIVFSVEKVRKVELVQGALTLTYENGESSYGYLADNGAVFNKIKAAKPGWLTFGGNVLYNPEKTRWITCTQTGNTVLGWTDRGSEWIADGCALHQQAIGKSS